MKDFDTDLASVSSLDLAEVSKCYFGGGLTDDYQLDVDRTDGLRFGIRILIGFRTLSGCFLPFIK